MSVNTRGGHGRLAGTSRGLEIGVAKGSGGWMGLAKTPGRGEGGSEIKPAAGVDATGMGISGLWGWSLTAISQSSACSCVFHSL